MAAKSHSWFALLPGIVGASRLHARLRATLGDAAETTDSALLCVYEALGNDEHLRIRQPCVIMYNAAVHVGVSYDPHVWFNFQLVDCPHCWIDLLAHLGGSAHAGLVLGICVLERHVEALTQGRQVECMVELLRADRWDARTHAKRGKPCVARCDVTAFGGVSCRPLPSDVVVPCAFGNPSRGPTKLAVELQPAGVFRPTRPSFGLRLVAEEWGGAPATPTPTKTGHERGHEHIARSHTYRCQLSNCSFTVAELCPQKKEAPPRHLSG